MTTKRIKKFIYVPQILLENSVKIKTMELNNLVEFPVCGFRK